MVLLWTALSYSVPGKVPSGVPRRLFSPLPWDSESLHHWTVMKVYSLISQFIISLPLNILLQFILIFSGSYELE